MRNKIIIPIVVFYISIALAYAVVPTPTLRYQFESNGDSSGTWNLPAKLGDLCVYNLSSFKEGSSSVLCSKETGGTWKGLINLTQFDVFSFNGTIASWVKLVSDDTDDMGFIFGGLAVTNTQGAYFYFHSSEYGIVGRSPTQIVKVSPRTDNTGEWLHLAFVWNSTNVSIYANGTLVKQGAFSNRTFTPTFPINIHGFSDYNFGDNAANAQYDDWEYWNNSVLTESQIYEVYSGIPSLPASSYMYIKAHDYYNKTNINGTIHAIINGTYYNNSKGSLNTTFTNSTINISIWFEFYHNYSILNWNSSVDLNASMLPFFIPPSINYSNYIEFSTINYTRNLSYNINYSCPSWSDATLKVYINDSINLTVNLGCYNYSSMLNRNSVYHAEQPFRINLQFNSTNYSFTKTFTNTVFIQDLYPPDITLLNMTMNKSGFFNPIGNISMRCLDNIMPNLTINLSLNNQTVYWNNVTNNRTQSNLSSALFGNNYLYGTCSDFFSTYTRADTINLYASTLYLIDEITGEYFNVTNLTSAKVYFDDNSSYFDFKQYNVSVVNFSTSTTNKLRFELGYDTGEIIQRFIDVSLFGSADIRVCANKQGVIHYTQFIISTSMRDAMLKSIFANCFVAADYTRNAYQNSLILKASTINRLYYLYTTIDDKQIILSTVDGTIESSIDLDTIEFAQRKYDLQVDRDAFVFSKLANSSAITIYYKNNQEENDAANIVIYNTDSDAIVFNSSVFADPNEITIIFDYSTLAATNETIFKLVMIKTVGETTSTITKYFNTLARSGILKSPIAVAVSILFILFGLTFTITRTTFSWFGVIIEMIAILLLFMSTGSIYTVWLAGIETIILVWTILVMIKQNSPTLS